ncbi:MAG: hypothetical protein ACI4EW_06875 [Butyrivibrio sp.]
MSTRDDWKETGKDLGHAFKGLGKNIIKSAKKGINKATDWAESDDNQTSAQTNQTDNQDNNQ